MPFVLHCRVTGTFRLGGFPLGYEGIYTRPASPNHLIQTHNGHVTL